MKNPIAKTAYLLGSVGATAMFALSAWCGSIDHDYARATWLAVLACASLLGNISTAHAPDDTNG
jgi:hypothetical protein